MQALATHADIEKRELVRFIVDGLDDKTRAVAMLYSARNLVELKNSVADYERYRTRHIRNLREIPPPRAVTVPRIAAVSPSTSDSTLNNVNRVVNEMTRCYNCRQFGHISTQCLKPKRPMDGCYHCFEVGHQHHNCPKKRKPVAAVTQNPSELLPPLNDPNIDGDLSDE